MSFAICGLALAVLLSIPPNSGGQQVRFDERPETAATYSPLGISPDPSSQPEVTPHPTLRGTNGGTLGTSSRSAPTSEFGGPATGAEAAAGDVVASKSLQSNRPSAVAPTYRSGSTDWFNASLSASRAILDVNFVVELTTYVSGGVGPFTFAYLGLPPGCASSNSSSLECYPSAPGTYVVSVRVTGVSGLNTAAGVVLLVRPALTMTVAANRSGVTIGSVVTLFAYVSGGTFPSPVRWQFGDGTGANGSAVTHFYTRLETYVASANVSDQDGAQAIGAVDITLHGSLNATTSDAPTVADALSPVVFTMDPAGGTPPYQVRWSFGDGTQGEGLEVLHPYLAAGVYGVVATLTDDGGARQVENLTQRVNPALHVVAEANNTSPHAGESVSFLALAEGGTGRHFYTWLFGDGGSSALSDPTYTYYSPGVDPVDLTVTDEAGGTANVTIIVSISADGTPPPVLPIGPEPSPPTRPTQLSPWVEAGVLAAAAAVAGLSVWVLRRRSRSP